MIKRKAAFFLLLCSLFLILAAGCGAGKAKQEETVYHIYCVNPDETAVISYDYSSESAQPSELLEELLAQLGTQPERLQYKAPLAGDFSLLSYELSEGQLLLNFSEPYKNQEIIKEVLTRAAIVQTLMQVKEVQYVSFLVNGEPLTDASGSVVGVMNRETFIDNKEINAYEKVKLQLYFANEAGDRLSAVSRTRVYNSNISMERLVVEEMIGGPKEGDAGLGNEQAYPVMNPETKIISVNVRDGICYVNLDESFLNQTYSVTPEVTIYALTNSLVELPNVNKVQISVEGKTNINYRKVFNLSTIFERNLDLVEQQ